MSTLEDQHRKRLAIGWRLVRIARGILYAGSVPMFGGAFAFLVMDEEQIADHTPLAMTWLILFAATALAFFTLGFMGQYLIRHSTPEVATDDDAEMPDVLRIGSARPLLRSTMVATILLVLIMATPFLISPRNWLCFGPMLVLALGAMVWLGPSWAGVSSAHLDSSGIRLPELGVHIPWTSVLRLEPSRRGVRLMLDGPASATGKVWAVWTGRAIRRLETEGGVEVLTNQPEKLIRFAQRHHSGSQR